MRDALTNLLLNAVDAVPDGGAITLAHTRSMRATSTSIVEVQDTGVGMSETTRSRCLEPFFTTKGERGTGLGLPMVFGMVQRHGGELEIDSELGHGTTMRLIVPERAHRHDGARTVAQTAGAGGCAFCWWTTIRCCCKSLRDALELDEHEVVTAEGGQAGIDAFAAALKAGTPLRRGDHRSGNAARGRSQGRARYDQGDGRKVPIIMLTGWGHRLIATDDKPEHVDRVLSKPPKMAELRNALAELVRPRRKTASRWRPLPRIRGHGW